jgi:hypothetical protein
MDLQKIKNRLSDLALDFKAYAELISKDRAKINKRDKRRILELEHAFSLVLEPEERSDFTTDVHGVASFFGVSIRTIQAWCKRGCPKLKRGLYDLKAVYTWWVGVFCRGEDSAQIEDVKLEYWREKTMRERIKRKQDECSLIPLSEAEALQAETVQVTVSSLNNWKNRLPPLIEMRPRAEIIEVMEREIYDFRERMYRIGSYAPKPMAPNRTGNLEKPR